MIFKLFAPDRLKHVLYPKEGEFTEEQLQKFNAQGYGIYWHPNCPKQYDPNRPVNGSDIDLFSYVFVDMDEKDGVWTKNDFIDEVLAPDNPEPTFLVDSGNGIHAYWAVSDLDPMSYLRFQRRLCRHFKTDEAVSKLCQVMRYPGTVNTKHEDAQSLAEMLHSSESVYSSEQLDAVLPPITMADEAYCKEHYDKTHNLVNKNVKVDDTLPLKFCQLLRSNSEVKEIWSGGTEDRSKADYRLGHIMFASAFTKEEARSVLVNSAKALARSPMHRIGYADGIIDKIWTYELEQDIRHISLSESVADILSKHADDESLRGTRFPCWGWIDNTQRGFRLTDVIGLVGGSGVGKTAVALNLFMGFVQSNPDFDHIFVSLEQPVQQIADRWQIMCGEDTNLHSKVRIIGNHNGDGTFRDLSLKSIKEHILELQKTKGKKIGCVVIDHIGVLSNDDRNGLDEGVKKLCKQMKSLAIETNTLLIMQSQTSREKAGIGDLELNKDAAFGTSVFENFCDFLITIWQPLKRVYDIGAPTVCAFKFCKIRHKKQNRDVIKEDVRYSMVFDPDTERLRETSQSEEELFSFYNMQAVNLRKQDRKTEAVPYVSARGNDGAA